MSEFEAVTGFAGDETPTRLIALDWGTSSLRAYRLGARGQVLASREAARGIMQLASLGEAAFEQALEEACGDWLGDAPAAPLIACGMIGSAQGWREAAYKSCPLGIEQLSAALLRIPTRRGRDLWVVPGVIQRGDLPNLMRGEETQVFGLLAEQFAGPADAPLLIGLPGSHSKWVVVEAGQIVGFHTFMTGEVYAALLGHTILGRTAAAGGAFDAAAFDRGLDVAGSSLGRGGVLSTIFSSRSLVLTGELAGQGQADYLSGLLIGHELLAMTKLCQATPAQRVVLIGSAALCQRYLRGLERRGHANVRLAPEATAMGLWQVARQAALVELRHTEEI